MAFGSDAYTTALLGQVMTELFDRNRKKAQFARAGETSRWFPRVTEIIKGKRYNFYAYTTPSTGTRGATFTNARANAWPAASQPGHIILSYDYGDVTVFKNTMKYNEFDDLQSSDVEGSIFKLANKLVGEALLDSKNKRNASLHLDTSGTMGTCAAVYDEDGTTYTGGQTDAFLQITDAPVSQFLKGQKLKASSRTQAQMTFEVADVIPGPDGPWADNLADRTAAVGPGIVVELVAGDSSDSDLDYLVATNTLSLSDEGAAGVNFSGLSSWFSGITNVYNDEDGSAINRDAVGNAWSIAELFNFYSGGNVNLDIEVHFRKVADYLPHRVNAGREARASLGPIQGVNEGVNLPGALVAITSVSLANEAVTQAVDTQRFTSATATSMDGAERRRLFGDIGFDGIVFHSATLPPMAMQADKSARENKMTIIDPQSWQWLRLAGPEIAWLTTGGSRWHRLTDSSSDDRLTAFMQAGYWMSALLFCDQMGGNCEIQGVKSSTF